MQLAFMAGAEHVWSSVINMLDPGEEPTDADMRRMDLIQRKWTNGAASFLSASILRRKSLM
jgi:hypothetical protein